MAKLSVLLSHLVRFAEEHPDEKQSTRLENGLSIDIKVEGRRDGSTHLQIHRGGVFPSSTEWATVLRHWPYKIQAAPRQVTYNGRNYLAAQWPTPRRLDLPETNVCAQTQDGGAQEGDE